MSDGMAFVRGASYVLGERAVDYTDIEDLDELARRFALAPNAGLWGWGTVRTTGRDLAELAADTGAVTLRAAGTGAASVDALVLCANRIPGPAEGHGRFVADVLTGIGLGDIPCYGQTLNRCVNLLAGLDVARALVTSGRHRRVLVITTDRVAAGVARISQFALFSDGAASCLVTSDPGAASAQDTGTHADTGTGASDGGRYELLDCATAQDTATLDWTSEISSDLARQVSDRLLTPAGLKLGDIAGLMHANLFKPLVVMKERQAGFSAEQLYLGNIPRVGHCFAADPLINLVDRAALGHLSPGSYCLLAASVPGSRIGALLRRVR
jgi:3-oxoacyl-[acyl-carrier-protein] synthase III